MYTTTDLLKKTTEIYKVEQNKSSKSDVLKSEEFHRNGKKQFISYVKPDIKKHDALELELRNFSNSISGIEKPIVDGESGRDALAIALEIQKIIKKDFF